MFHLFDPDPPLQTLVWCCNLFFSPLLVSIFAIANQVDWSSAGPQVWQSAGLSRPPQFPNRHAELDSTINWLFIKVSRSWTSDLPRGRFSYPINCRMLLWGPAAKRMSVLTSRTAGLVCLFGQTHLMYYGEARKVLTVSLCTKCFTAKLNTYAILQTPGFWQDFMWILWCESFLNHVTFSIINHHARSTL